MRRRLRPEAEWLERRRLLVALNTTEWTDIGPAPILSSQPSDDGHAVNNRADAGRITAVAWGSQGLYVAAAGGGVWRTTSLNGNTNPIPADIHWSPLGQTQDSGGLDTVPLFIGSLAVIPGAGANGQDMIFAGTGEPNNSNDSFYGRGLLVSTDGGATWTRCNNGGRFDRVTISKIIVPLLTSPAPINSGDDSVIVAIGPPGANGNTDPNRPVISGVYLFSFQGGQEHWTPLNDGLPQGTSYTISDIVQDPFAGQLYAAIGDSGDLRDPNTANNGVYAFDASTGRWSVSGNFPMGGDDGRIALAIGDDVSDILSGGSFPTVYASIAGSARGATPGQLINILQMRRDPAKINANDPTSPAPDVWTPLPMTPADSRQYLGQPPNPQGNYDTTLFEPSPILQGPFALMASGDGDGPFSVMQTAITYDNANNPLTDWTDLSQDGQGGNPPHGDHHYLGYGYDQGFSNYAIRFGSLIGGGVFDGNDGGLWLVQPGGTASSTTWTDLNGDLEITQFNSIALDPKDPNKVYGGTQDNGTVVSDGSRMWQEKDGGDGGAVVVDPAPGQSQTIYHMFYRQPLGADPRGRQPIDPTTNGLEDNNFLAKSTDGGKTWTMLDTTGQISTTEDSDLSPPLAAVALPPDPAHPNAPPVTRLVVGTTNLYESTDGGKTWQNLTRFSTNWPRDMRVHSIAVSATNPDTMYVSLVTPGGTVGFVEYTNDNGTTWRSANVNIDRSGGRGGVAIPVGDLKIDPRDDRVVYGVRDQFNTDDTKGHVYRIVVDPDTSRSVSDDITGNLPDLPTNAIATDLVDGSTILYVGNDAGVWVSYDGATWTPLGGQLPHVQVTDLQVGHYAGETVLAAATYGRGVWEIDTTLSLSVNDVSQEEGDAGTTAFTFTITLSHPVASDVTVQVATADGTATAPRDYAALNQTVVIPAFATTATFTVNVVGNTLYEHDETFTVNLSAAKGASIARGQGVGTILNDDPAPTFSVTVGGPVVRPITGTVNLVFTVTLTGATEVPAQVDYETDDVTAISPDDYTEQAGTIVFNPDTGGPTTRMILVPVIAGAQSDPSRTFLFHLDTPRDAAIGQGDATGTILGNAKELDIQRIPPVEPELRNLPVPEIEVVFSGAIQPGSFGAGALSLALDGADVPLTAPLAFVPVNASTYLVEGLAPLTSADGTYTLTVDAGSVLDASGAAGRGTASVSWLMDTIAPTSAVEPLPPRQSSLAFPVAAGGADPGSGSGIASYALYVAVDGGPFTFWQSVPASDPTAEFTGQSNQTYSFYGVATDAAGNVEAKAPGIEATTYVPDLDPPAVHVATVGDSSPTFTVSWSGTDAGGSGLYAVDLYASIDGGAPRRFARVAGGAAAGEAYSGAVAYAAIADGSTHTYRFYAVGTDGAGNVEAVPTAPGADAVVSAAFPGPSAIGVVSLTVQGGAVGRSYVRYVDINFDESGGALQELIDDHRIRLVQHQLDGLSRPTDPAVDLSAARLTAIDHAIEIDFGAGGLGGNPDSTAGDGYYEIDLDLNGSGAFATHEFFYRLLGDVDGDHAVGAADLGLITASLGRAGVELLADVDGDGTVSALDRSLASRSRGRHLAAGLELDG